MENDELITYCGIYYSISSKQYEHNLMNYLSKAMLHLIDTCGAHDFKSMDAKDLNFEEFHKVLTFLSERDSGFSCLKECRDKSKTIACKIRTCVIDHGLFICFECKDFPCSLVLSNTKIMKRAEEYKRLGREEWIKKRKNEEKEDYRDYGVTEDKTKKEEKE